MGSLSLSVSGLPIDVDADITVTGPTGLRHSVRESVTLERLLPGEYRIAATAVSKDGATYDPGTPSQAVVVASVEATSASISYSATTAN